MVVIGYKITGTDIQQTEIKIEECRQQLIKEAKKLYHQKLGEEIAFLCDSIALNILKKNENEVIFDCAVNNLEQMIRTGALTGIAAEYNFQVFVQIMNHEGNTYLKVICPNQKLLKAFRSLQPYSLDETEVQNPQNSKNIVWQKLHAIYKDRPPLTVNLTPQIKADKNRIIYPSLKERCIQQARYHMQNHILNQISGGREIPPFRMMGYLDEMIKILDTPEAKRDLEKKTQELTHILPDLENDDSFIFDKNPG